MTTHGFIPPHHHGGTYQFKSQKWWGEKFCFSQSWGDLGCRGDFPLSWGDFPYWKCTIMPWTQKLIKGFMFINTVKVNEAIWWLLLSHKDQIIQLVWVLSQLRCRWKSLISFMLGGTYRFLSLWGDWEPTAKIDYHGGTSNTRWNHDGIEWTVWVTRGLVRYKITV